MHRQLTCHARHRSTVRTHGFTLIELVAVMVLIAIMSAVAVPSIANLPSMRAGAAARQLARDLIFARQQAMARGATVWVVFNTTNEAYSILAESAASPGLGNAVALTDPATGLPFVQVFTSGEFANVDLSWVIIGGSAGTHLGFDWLGRPVDSDGTLLTVLSSVRLNSGAYIITVAAQGGAVTVSP
ncbi:MAG: Tfp pilus assembly protein FimT/FimU [bacterium]|jgi:prepilin-type N-terminal cleavage/methylation domain-containing protein